MRRAVTGGCLCRAVRFRLDAPVLGGRLCWCRDCQYLACGNASVGVFGSGIALLVEGATAEFVSRADSGALIRRRFCPICGTHLFSDRVGERDHVVIRAGTLDDAGSVAPSSVIWAGSAPSWACFDPALPRHARQMDIEAEP